MNTGDCSEGSKKANREIEQKLIRMEHNLDQKSHTELPAAVSSQDLIKIANPVIVQDDLFYFSGIALIIFAVLVFFQHVHVGTGLLQALGMGAGGFGLLMLPLLLGLGLIVYNHKNRLGYVILSVTSAIIFYSVLSSLIVTFAPMSLLGLIIMLLPLSIGGAFIVRGMGGPKGIEYKLRKQGLLKSEIGSVNKTK